MELEEYAWVLDYLPEGKASEREREPIAQVIGEKFFTLLEIVAKPDAKLVLEQRIYIGKESRAETDHIKGRIRFEDLTNTGRRELRPVLKKIIERREMDFISFFNKCGPISIRLHQLELIPGIGKKHMEEILEQREKKPFESFKDLRARVPLLPDPVNILLSRIEKELEGREQHYIFVKPPFRKEF